MCISCLRILLSLTIAWHCELQYFVFDCTSNTHSTVQYKVVEYSVLTLYTLGISEYNCVHIYAVWEHLRTYGASCQCKYTQHPLLFSHPGGKLLLYPIFHCSWTSLLQNVCKASNWKVNTSASVEGILSGSVEFLPFSGYDLKSYPGNQKCLVLQMAVLNNCHLQMWKIEFMGM